ncbi:MAG: DUF4249 domain-containing protein [Bacteroidales bacterium]|jgi:hypothetical protein|nr:DUF4249 domain-containing protein [Bacteroidales bacterium]
MNAVLHYFFAIMGFCIIFFASSCEEEMKDFDMQTAQSLLVIDAECNAMNDSITVRLSKTIDFLSNEKNPPVQGAVITLRYNSVELPLMEQSTGFYAACATFPEETTYTLSVEFENQTYTATSYMPSTVPMLSLIYTPAPPPIFSINPNEKNDSAFHVTFAALDPQNEQNFYRVIVHRNDTLANKNELMVIDDTFFSSDTITYTPYYRFYAHDSITVELRSFDRTSYQYYMSMQAAMQTGGAFSLPDNPKSNFSGGALGHFTSFAGDKKMLRIIPQ